MITHSPYLTDASDLDHTWRIGRGENSSLVHSVGSILGTLSPQDKDRVLLKLGRPELRALFFSRGVVFVEGPSDKIVIEETDRHLSAKGIGADLEGEEWGVIYLDGKSSLRIFLDLVRILNMEFAALLDYDALMKCENSMHKNGNKMAASPVFLALHHSGRMSTSDLESLRKAQASLVRINGDQWFAADYLDELSKIARSHHIYILEKDLEGAMQTPKTIREKKPLRSMQRILELVDNDKVPEEIKRVDAFLRERIRISSSERAQAHPLL